MTSPAPQILVDDLPTDCRDAAVVLNRDCFCRTVDHGELRRALESEGGLSYADLQATRPNLFSDTVVFVAQAHLAFMADLVDS